MKLEIEGLALNAHRFSSVWGRYVTGFSDTNHCQASLKGIPENELANRNKDEPLNLRTEFKYFYPCALGKPRSSESNVHLVVTPRPEAVASVGSLYGVTFKISDALAVRINGLPKGWRKLGDEFTQCPNFQFAVQTYGYPDPDGSLDFGPAILIPKPVRNEAS